MHIYIEKLLSISSSGLCDSFNSPSAILSGASMQDLIEMLGAKNGFFAFESSLHVFSSTCAPEVMDIEAWNAPQLWKREYESELQEILFFAEDVFGEQFGLQENAIIRFDPETANVEEFAEDLNDWAKRILEDYDVETGYPIASEWQEINGPLVAGQRLIPKIPFILGGEYTVDNLYALDAVKAMHLRADICRQVKHLPKDSKVKLKITGLREEANSKAD